MPVQPTPKSISDFRNLLNPAAPVWPNWGAGTGLPRRPGPSGTLAPPASGVGGDWYNSMLSKLKAMKPAPPTPPVPTGVNFDNDSFLASLASSRGDIIRQAQNAQAEAARQNQYSLSQIGQLPGDYNKLYDQSTGQINENAAALEAAQRAGANFTGTTGAEAQIAPILSALAMQRSGSLSGVPLLEAGTREMGTRRSVELSGQEGSLLADIGRQEAEYRAGREAEARQREYERAALLDERAYAEKSGGGASRDPIATALAINEGKILQNMAYGTGDFRSRPPNAQERTVQALLRQYSPSDIDADRGAALMQSPNVLRKLQADKDYQAAVREIEKVGARKSKKSGGFFGINRKTKNSARDKKKAIEAIIARLARKGSRGKPRAASLLRHLYGGQDANGNDKAERAEGILVSLNAIAPSEE